MRGFHLFFIGLLAVTAAPGAYAAKAPPADPEFDQLLSEDLSDLTVTSVSKRAQRLSDTAAAVYVITQEDIRRAGIYTIPEALRMVPGVQVARVSTNRWAVSVRGFNSTLDNKLLVLIDGRSIYTPVFSGVYWDDQSTSINDIDRIEVIRGPGASLYGANAVNGVINIITKNAADTQGNFISATANENGNGLYEARHGGQTQGGDYYRVYGKYLDASKWYRGRSGFRLDGRGQDSDTYTVEGDAYGGQQDAQLLTPTTTAPYTHNVFSTDDAYGGDVLARWNHVLSKESSLNLQAYVDHYSRLESNFDQHVSTADVQLQHKLQSDRHQFIWGGGARMYYEDLLGTFSASTSEQYALHHILNVFAQDEYALVPDSLYLTAGSKFEHNDYTGFEIEPTVRLAWHATDDQTVWAAVSRAVRTPSTVEENINLLALVAPTAPLTEYRVFGSPQQKAEDLIAYELGHRIQATRDLSFDTALYFNQYTNIQTIGAAGAPFTGADGNTIIPYTVDNLGSGHVYGGEVSSRWHVSNDWQLEGSYTYMKMSLDVKPGTATTLEAGERLAPRNQFAVQSYYNLSENVHWDNMVYYVAHLSPPVDSYVRYDTRLAWLARPGLELSLIGRNLLGSHEEFPGTPQYKVGRTVIGQILWKF